MAAGTVSGVLHRPITVEAMLLCVLAALAGSGVALGVDAPVGSLVGLLLLPIWLPTLLRQRLVTWLCAMFAMAVVTGLLLSLFMTETHAWTPSGVASRSFLLIGLIGGIGLLLHVVERVGPSAAAISYGGGMVVAALLDDPSTVNAWRFTFSIPVAVLTLAVLSLWEAAFPQIIALLVLAGIGVVNGARSNSSMLVLAAVVIAWQALSRSLRGPGRRAGNVLGVVLFAAALFQLAQTAILEGFFGEATRQRTEAQLTASGGSIFFGGRPEAAASYALILRYPFGLGSGTEVNLQDISSASAAMRTIGYDPDNNYVKSYLFGGPVEVHSVVGDFWLWFGIPGIAACALIVILMVRGVNRALGNAALSGLFAYLAIRVGWDLLFSPASSASRTLILVVPLAAIVVMARGLPEKRLSSAPPQEDRRLPSRSFDWGSTPAVR